MIFFSCLLVLVAISSCKNVLADTSMSVWNGLSSIKAASTCSSHSEQNWTCPDYCCSSELRQCSEEEDCSSGLFCVNGFCQCGVYPDYNIICNGTDAFSVLHYCVTLDEDTNEIIAGICIGHKSNYKIRRNYTSPYHRLQQTSKLNSATCGTLFRDGPLCGKCENGSHPLAYHYGVACAKCQYTHWNWLKYMIAAYLPLTALYVIVLFFKINTTSSRLFAVVYYCQTLSMPLLIRTTIMQVVESRWLRAVVSIYGIWNLDFFRLYYSNLCLNIDILSILALDYAVCFYPILLIAITYLLIVLHDRNCRVIVCIWSPFRVLFSLIRRSWNIRTTVIDAFATFFFLSNMKLLSVSFDLLYATKAYHLNPTCLNYSVRVFYAGTLAYFGPEHLPYAVVSIIVLIMFVILPSIVLALYPFSLFQKILRSCPVRRSYVLHIFVDSFHGCYKDGTEPGTRDYRWFASVFFFIRLLHYTIYALVGSVLAIFLCTLVILLHVTLIAILRPFKTSAAHHNEANILFLMFVVLFSFSAEAFFMFEYLAPQYTTVCVVFEALFVVIPLLYMLLLILHWIYKNRRFGTQFVRRFKAWRNRYAVLFDTDDRLPDRIVNSQDYPKENTTNFRQMSTTLS